MMSSDAEKIVAEAEQLWQSGNHDDALRLSGEELARADNAWRRAHNAGTDVSHALADVTTLGITHADMLFRAGAFSDAYSTALTVLMAVAFEDRVAQSWHHVNALLCIALAAFEQLAAQMPHDSFTRQHVPVIFGYLASLAYHYYTLTLKERPDQWHARLYPMLNELLSAGAVQSPSITVHNPDGVTQVSPDSPVPVLNDLIGRSVALGIMAG